MSSRKDNWSCNGNSIVSMLAVLVIVAGCSSGGHSSNSSGPPAPQAVGNISASSTAVSFASTQVGSTTTQNVMLTVSGASVTVTSTQVSGTGFTVTPPMLPSTLSPGQTMALAVQFAPPSSGQLSGSLTIASNASNSTVTVALSGTGTAVPSNHSAVVSWESGDQSAVAYRVYRSNISGGPYEVLTASPVTQTSYTDSTVSAGSTYFYVVTELDTAGDESAFSSEVSATVP